MKNAHFFISVLCLLTLAFPMLSFKSFDSTLKTTQTAMMSEKVTQQIDSNYVAQVLLLTKEPNIDAISWKTKMLDTVCAVISTLLFALAKKFLPNIFAGSIKQQKIKKE